MPGVGMLRAITEELDLLRRQVLRKNLLLTTMFLVTILLNQNSIALLGVVNRCEPLAEVQVPLPFGNSQVVILKDVPVFMKPPPGQRPRKPRLQQRRVII